jgi:DNA repair exonuclease SbcCD ATPase subunit
MTHAQRLAKLASKIKFNYPAEPSKETKELLANAILFAADIAARERELEARIATLECHLDFLGWSSDGIQAARDQLAAANAEIERLRAENQTAAANSEIGGLESLVEDLQEDLYGEDK